MNGLFLANKKKSFSLPKDCEGEKKSLNFWGEKQQKGNHVFLEKNDVRVLVRSCVPPIEGPSELTKPLERKRQQGKKKIWVPVGPKRAFSIALEEKRESRPFPAGKKEKESNAVKQLELLQEWPFCMGPQKGTP